MKKFLICCFAAAAAVNFFRPEAEQKNPPEKKNPAAGAVQRKAETKFLTQMSAIIRLYGYDCQRVDQAFPHIMSLGFEAFCTGRTGIKYRFTLEDHGGKWSVTAD